MIPRPPTSTLFPYTTLFRSHGGNDEGTVQVGVLEQATISANGDCDVPRKVSRNVAEGIRRSHLDRRRDDRTDLCVARLHREDQLRGGTRHHRVGFTGRRTAAEVAVACVAGGERLGPRRRRGEGTPSLRYAREAAGRAIAHGDVAGRRATARCHRKTHRDSDAGY